jgi:polyhydroxyalkanoate synthesis regulator phasin
LNPQDRIRRKLAFLNTQKRIATEEEAFVINKKIDELEQELKDLNNMGKRQFRGGKNGKSV